MKKNYLLLSFMTFLLLSCGGKMKGTTQENNSVADSTPMGLLATTDVESVDTDDASDELKLDLPAGYQAKKTVWGEYAYTNGAISVEAYRGKQGDENMSGGIIGNKKQALGTLESRLRRGSTYDVGEGKALNIDGAIASEFTRALVMVVGTDDEWVNIFIFYPEASRSKAIDLAKHLAKTTKIKTTKKDMSPLTDLFEGEKVDLMNPRLEARLVALVGKRNFYYMNGILEFVSITGDHTNRTNGQRLKEKPENYTVTGWDRENNHQFVMTYNIPSNKLSVTITFGGGEAWKFDE